MENELPEILSTSSSHAIAEWRGHVLGVWQTAPSVESARELALAVERLARLYPGRSTYLAYLRPMPTLPPEEVRRVYVELGRRVSELLNCIGVVIEGTGFTAAALRAVVTGLGLTANIRFPMRSFSTLTDMTAWVRPRLLAAQSRFGTDGEIKESFSYLTKQLQTPDRGAHG